MGNKTRKSYRLNVPIGTAAVFLLLIACNFNTKKVESASPNKQKAPVVDKVPKLACSLLQSHSDILTAKTPQGAYQVTLNYSQEGEEVVKLAHINQLNIQEDNSIRLDSSTFEFNQLHFHSPCEHSIDGVSFPLEMHIVNSIKDSNRFEYLVVVILFKMGDESIFIREFMEQGHGKNASDIKTQLQMILGAKLVQEKTNIDLQGFYNYKGSLETASFSENVNWFIVKKVFEVSPDQTMKIKKIQ